MKQTNRLAMVGRLICYALFGLAVGMAVATLSGCTLVTDALRGIGIPVGAGATEAAKQVDLAIRSWVDALIWGGAGVATSEGARATHRTIKKRAAKKAAA
jgi:hypothetical protein